MFKFVIKYISPVYLLLVFAAWCYKEFYANPTQLEMLRTKPVALACVMFIVVVGVFFALLIAQSVRRWRKLEQHLIRQQAL